MAENNLDGIGRRLRAPRSQHANAEELLVELVRLVESSRLAPERSPARVETVSLHPLVEAPSNKPRVTRVVDVEPPRAPESDHSYGPTVSLAPHRTEIATPTPSATDSGVAAHASDAPLPPVRPAPKADQRGWGCTAVDAKLDLPTHFKSICRSRCCRQGWRDRPRRFRGAERATSGHVRTLST